MVRQRLYISLVLLIVAQIALSQKVIKPKLIEVDWKGIIYKNEWSLDLRLHENGAAIAYNTGTIKSYNRTNYYQLELGYTKDIREKAQSKFSTLGSRTGTYAYGKINSVINVRGGVGVKHYLSEKEKRNGLAVGYTYEIGPSLALLKPYYLDLIYVETLGVSLVPTIRREKYSPENADKFLDLGSISNKASFTKGLDELKVSGGVQGKLGLHCAMGAFDEYVKAFETGIMFDIFATRLPIMIETEDIKNSRFFFKLYLNIQLGKRSN